MSDDDFIEQFEQCTFPAADFDHRNHVRLAWLYLGRLGLQDALARFVTGIKRFATANGAAGRYHETITWAFVLLINERMARGGNEQGWEDFAVANADLLDWKENILKTYYREETLQSELARKVFVFPDAGRTRG